MTTKTVNISADRAKEMIDVDEALRLNGSVIRHRTLSAQMIGKILNDITGDDWHLNHQGMALTKRGEIIDGRHRLYAIYYSKKTVPVRVTDDLTDEEAHEMMLTIDCGRPRDVGTQLWIAEGVENATKICAAIRAQVSLAKGVKREYGGISASKFMRIQQYEAKELSAVWSVLAMQRPKVHSGLFGALTYYANAHRKNALEFAELYTSGAGLGVSSPVLWLKRTLGEEYRSKQKRHRVGEISFVVANAVFAYHHHKRQSTLFTADMEGSDWLIAESPKLTKLLQELPYDRPHKEALKTASDKLQTKQKEETTQ